MKKKNSIYGMIYLIIIKYNIIFENVLLMICETLLNITRHTEGEISSIASSQKCT